jgi:hypothetical protein
VSILLLTSTCTCYIFYGFKLNTGTGTPLDGQITYRLHAIALNFVAVVKTSDAPVTDLAGYPVQL